MAGTLATPTIVRANVNFEIFLGVVLCFCLIFWYVRAEISYTLMFLYTRQGEHTGIMSGVTCSVK